MEIKVDVILNYRILWEKRRTRRKRRTPQIGFNKAKKHRNRRNRGKATLTQL